MDYKMMNNNDITVLLLPMARLDANTSIDLKTEIDKHILENKNKFILDFTKVGFIDSSALGLLVSLVKSSKPSVQFVITHIEHPIILDVIYLTRMDKILNIQTSLESAIKYFSE